MPLWHECLEGVDRFSPGMGGILEQALIEADGFGLYQAPGCGMVSRIEDWWKTRTLACPVPFRGMGARSLDHVQPE